MKLEQETRPKFGLSTFCFLDKKLRQGPNYLWAAVTGKPYTPEIEAGFRAAKSLGLGLELIYRKGTNRQVLAAFGERKVPILQVHGPVWYDLPSAFHSGWREVSKWGTVINPLSSLLAIGTLEADFERCLRLTQKLKSPSVVLHPGGAEILHQGGLSLITPFYEVNLAIEADHRRPTEASCWIWQPEKTMEIAQKLREGICMDTSHTITSQRSIKHLSETYDEYKKAPKGVLSVHLSAAIPEENPWELHRKGNADLPLDPEIIPSYVLGAFREFYQHLLQDKFSGPIIVELARFRRGDSFDQRLKAIEVTLNSLETTPQPPRSISLPGRPTTLPL